MAKTHKKKAKKVYELTWSFENFEEHSTFYTKSMFGCLAAYVHHRMMSLLAESEGDRTYRDVTFDFDIWNGILYPTEFEHQDSIQKEFPNLIQHPVLKKWLYLPIKAKNFEETAHDIALCIRKNDKRFGIYPQLSRPGKKKKKTSKTKKKATANKVAKSKKKIKSKKKASIRHKRV
ncbi:MAG: hypothetical protein KDD33_10925 [Bdellovibrionales bacterium]|nr:hypothetical protein [Bdellovibrionales bacterium]